MFSMAILIQIKNLMLQIKKKLKMGVNTLYRFLEKIIGRSNDCNRKP